MACAPAHPDWATWFSTMHAMIASHKELAVELNLIAPWAHVAAALDLALPVDHVPRSLIPAAAQARGRAVSLAPARRAAEAVVLVSIGTTWASGVLVSPNGRTSHAQGPHRPRCCTNMAHRRCEAAARTTATRGDCRRAHEQACP